MKRLEIKGVDFGELTLHVGLGTFSPVEVEDLSKHKTDSEQISISPGTAQLINDAIVNKRRICAVGTTVMRAVESSVSASARLNSYTGWTNKFIFPPYDRRDFGRLLHGSGLPDRCRDRASLVCRHCDRYWTIPFPFDHTRDL